MDYDKVAALPRPEHKLPRKTNLFWSTLIKALTYIGMAGTKFTYETERMELLKKDEPCLILMNHSCFLDMQIAYRIMYPRSFNIVCTTDGMIGKNWLMHQIGCIPTKKFLTDS
jgi:1-acyl-sn-glycerol-3-phosphate acyltransferase